MKVGGRESEREREREGGGGERGKLVRDEIGREKEKLGEMGSAGDGV